MTLTYTEKTPNIDQLRQTSPLYLLVNLRHYREMDFTFLGYKKLHFRIKCFLGNLQEVLMHTESIFK